MHLFSTLRAGWRLRRYILQGGSDLYKFGNQRRASYRDSAISNILFLQRVTLYNTMPWEIGALELSVSGAPICFWGRFITGGAKIPLHFLPVEQAS
jgi:hypothetical protein